MGTLKHFESSRIFKLSHTWATFDFTYTSQLIHTQRTFMYPSPKDEYIANMFWVKKSLLVY